eukprot:TRINITY_DN370_c1_g1_i2.p1 TRINITY_DN370_c1_g1~~TRINITY_DN370_c1_g1_i2.p1  ORF type:complete len:351 (+),score=114.90 TRINITY_DN370_c1_g1_i2:203-1255(+)
MVFKFTNLKTTNMSNVSKFYGPAYIGAHSLLGQEKKKQDLIHPLTPSSPPHSPQLTNQNPPSSSSLSLNLLIFNHLINNLNNSNNFHYYNYNLNNSNDNNEIINENKTSIKNKENENENENEKEKNKPTKIIMKKSRKENSNNIDEKKEKRNRKKSTTKPENRTGRIVSKKHLKLFTKYPYTRSNAKILKRIARSTKESTPATKVATHTVALAFNCYLNYTNHNQLLNIIELLEINNIQHNQLKNIKAHYTIDIEQYLNNNDNNNNRDINIDKLNNQLNDIISNDTNYLESIFHFIWQNEVIIALIGRHFYYLSKLESIPGLDKSKATRSRNYVSFMSFIPAPAITTNSY